MKKVDYRDYCRQVRKLKEINGINKSLKMLLLDLADMHGVNGKIFPNNATLAENNRISEKSIEGLLSRARTNDLIKSSPARKGQERFITLLCPDTGEPIFLYIRKKNQNNFANTQKKSAHTYYRTDKVKDNNNAVVSPETEKALKLIRPGETITSEMIATIEDGIKRLKYEIVASIILYVNDHATDNYGGYLCEAIRKGWMPQKSKPRYVKITDDMSKSEQQCCKCFNSNLKKPSDQRCFIVWGDTAPTKICANNCPGVIQKMIGKEISK